MLSLPPGGPYCCRPLLSVSLETLCAILSGRLFHTETGHVHLLSRPLFYLSVMRRLTLGTESAEADGRTAYLTTHKYIGTGRDLQTALLDHAPDSLLCHPGLVRHLCHRSPRMVLDIIARLAVVIVSDTAAFLALIFSYPLKDHDAAALGTYRRSVVIILVQ